MPERPTVRESVFAFLRDAGMTTVFGNPGSTELRFMRTWPSDFRYVTALHEGCAVAMADAYAQVTRNAAFVNLHSAGGLGNAMGCLFTAYKNQTPLVITAGQQSRALLPSMPFLYAVDATELPKPYVKWSCEPARAEDVPLAIERAYRIAMQPPYGPAFVSIPEDDWDRDARAVPKRTLDAHFTTTGSALDAVVAALERCARPAIVVGPGVDRDEASDAAVAIAERTGAAVYVSPLSSRCSFPERHPNFSGFLPPVSAQIAAALEPYDLVLVVGAPIFTYHVFSPATPIASGTVVFQLVDDPTAIAAAPIGTSILTTLREALTEIARRLPVESGARTVAGRAAPREITGEAAFGGVAAMRTLAATIPAGTLVFEEAPSHRAAMHDYFPIERAGTFFAAASGSLGWALPAAVGAALARPSERVVAIVGDGSSMYAIQGLWTAARLALPITFVVLNNGAYAAMNQFGRYLGFDGMPSFDLAGLDFVRAAEAFGVRGVRAMTRDDFERALRTSLASPAPTLIDACVTDPAADIY